MTHVAEALVPEYELARVTAYRNGKAVLANWVARKLLEFVDANPTMMEGLDPAFKVFLTTLITDMLAEVLKVED